ncbi:MAG TPA: segregation/condensation protein A [Candidatus Thermoplasmatota archaeon]|nr:segregation/condensation protein A [Candidatus Thermoplasmatota archaeon]
MTTQTTLRTSQVVRHLLWHKALAQDEDDGSRIDRLLDVVQASDDGEHVAIRDPFHRDLAIAFELVIQNHLNPWDLDLSKFAELYLKEAQSRGVDLVTAGRIILMAWTVLKLQSDEVADRAVQEPAAAEEVGGDNLPDWTFTNEEWDFTERVQALPQAPIDEKIRHKGDRRVTLMELIGAFEEAHREADVRRVLVQQRLDARLSLARKMRGRLGNMMHKEDLHAEIQETWQRILEYPTHPIPFSGLHEAASADLVQTFNGLLFLMKDGKVQVSQEEFPRGEIWVTPVLAEAAALLPPDTEVKA